MNIRYAKPEDLDWIKHLAYLEGWNPGLHDMQAFYAQDDKGFLIGEVENRKVGCVSCVKYMGGFGFLGFYIVLPEFRGKGFGLQLFRMAQKEMQGYCIGLDGVFSEQQNYAKSGFAFAYRNLRFEYINQIHSFFDAAIVDGRDISFAQTEEFDRKHFLYERKEFLKSWLALPDSQTKVFLDRSDIQGYGCIRKCYQGYKIGPLFAVRATVARELFISLCSSVEPDCTIYLDIPEVNQAALILASEFNMRSVFGTARMYNAVAPKLPVNQIYGVTTFELG